MSGRLPLHPRRRDPDWLLGLAQVRAKQILALIRLHADRQLSVEVVLKAIGNEAQAILDDRETPSEPEV
jgi:hypothetical protein